MEIRKGLYKLTCIRSKTPGAVCLSVADPGMGMFMEIGGDELATLIDYLQQANTKGETNG